MTQRLTFDNSEKYTISSISNNAGALCRRWPLGPDNVRFGVYNQGQFLSESVGGVMDIEALYTNIPQRGALGAVKSALERSDSQDDHLFILECLAIVLQENYFEFDKSVYKQIQGVSMGAACAPNVANIYMGAFEDRFIFNKNAPFFENIFHWHRFIDDIFFIWRGPEEQLTELILRINLCDPHLKFSPNMNRGKIEFLDVWIQVVDQTIEVSLYTKPTARNTLLQYESYHPRCQKDSIPFSQFLRLCRNCTTIQNFDFHAEQLKTKPSKPPLQHPRKWSPAGPAEWGVGASWLHGNRHDINTFNIDTCRYMLNRIADPNGADYRSTGTTF